MGRGHMRSFGGFEVGSGSAAVDGVTTYLNIAPQEAGK